MAFFGAIFFDDSGFGTPSFEGSPVADPEIARLLARSTRFTVVCARWRPLQMLTSQRVLKEREREKGQKEEEERGRRPTRGEREEKT